MTAMVTNRPYKTPICMYSHGDIPSVRECLKLHHILTNQILFFPFKKICVCVCTRTKDTRRVQTSGILELGVIDSCKQPNSGLLIEVKLGPLKSIKCSYIK